MLKTAFVFWTSLIIASFYPAAVPLAAASDRPGVVAYYTFDGHSLDSSANGYDGLAHNVSYADDVPGQLGAGRSAYWGDHSVIRCIDLPVIRGLGPRFTITSWVKLPASYRNEKGGTSLLANSSPAGSGFQYYVNSWNSDNRRLVFETAGDGSKDYGHTANHALTDGMWHHLALVRDGGSVLFYVDGVLKDALDSEVSHDFSTDLSLRIGHNFQASGDLNWSGHIDDLALWDDALDGARIAALANGEETPAAYLSTPVRAVAYYPFDDHVNDGSGLNYHGTPVNLEFAADVPAAIGDGKSLSWGDHSVQRYLEIPELKELNSAFSVSCWVKIPEEYKNPGRCTTLLASSLPQSAGFQWWLNNWNSDDRRLVMATRDRALAGDAAHSVIGALADGVWQHLTMVRNGSEVSFYVNGALIAMSNTGITEDFPTEQPLRLGHNFQNTADTNWSGLIDDFAIWDGPLSLNTIAALADGSDSPANHVVPDWWSARFVDEMDGFYRYGTMVDVWLKDGGGLVTVPDYLTTAGDFPYKKRDYSKEGLFTDHWFLVRSLGGWSEETMNGKGEFSSGTNKEDFDVVYRSGGELIYRWDKLFPRLKGYLDMGYRDITLVMDGVPWAFTANPVAKEYGNATPPDDMEEWYNFMTELGSALTNHLTTEYGSDIVNRFRFRIGTELRGRLEFSSPEQWLRFYDATAVGLGESLPGHVSIGMANYAGGIAEEFGEEIYSITDLARHCVEGLNFQNGSVGSRSDWMARSVYTHKTENGQPNINPVGSAAGLVRDMQTIEDQSGLVAPSWEVHELGILENEYDHKTEEPGVYGGTWFFTMMTQLYSGGFEAIQHWNLTEKVGTVELLHGQGWPLMVLDHLRGGKFYLLDAPADSPAKTKYCAYAVDKGSKRYLLISAFNVNRLESDPQTVTVTVPRHMFPLAETSSIRYIVLNAESSVYDVIRHDLKQQNLLDTPWSANESTIASVAAMSGENKTAARDFIVANWSKYQDLFNKSLTLEPFEGTWSTVGDEHQFTLELSAPSILVIAVE